MINGSNNSPGNNNAKFINVKNGSPPNNALRRPTTNPANAAGIKLINASSNNLNGRPNNLNNPCANNVPSNANASAKIQLSGLNGPNKNKLSGNDNKNNSCGNNKFLIKSLKIFNGNRSNLNKLNNNKNNGTKNAKSIARLRNGIKLGRPSKIAANNGLNNPSKALNNKIGRFNNAKKIAVDVPKARSNPRPLINNGATTKILNSFNKNNGNVINPCNNNCPSKNNGNPIKKLMMCESNPAPRANRPMINGRTNKKYGIVKKIQPAKFKSPNRSSNN